jgi:hypothetical protein
MQLWHHVNDEPSARRAVERAARITTVWAVINVGLGIISILSGSRITERDPLKWQGGVIDNGGQSISGYAFLFVGILFGLVAWKMRRMSLPWALGGLILAAITLLADFAETPSPIALIFHAFVIISFINAVRATVKFQRLQSEQSPITGAQI